MTSSMLIRVDFMDLKDPLGLLSDMLNGFRPIHVGMKYGDHYLSVPRNEPSCWRPYDVARRIVESKIVHSFEIDPPYHDPKLVALMGEGWVVDSGLRMFLTEWLHVGADLGMWSYKPNRVTCVGTISRQLRLAGLDIHSTTSFGLYRELMSMHSAGLATKTK